ncbi:YHS domain-containing protein [Alkalimarinus alittae]|uniref:YHS domain-containing protein n=1 Tax=Alkalimarinus alittae TaxID=2961619 RepID=A0ABY6MXF1_9ALTE|nr:YHS domain-containing protein [Alkalimarinus alittae]UZE94505.1 YHS domain-containing protein [Alkalimarinus alittae]
MDGLFSFLLFAALFYFMMRHGCGSHSVHGHGGHHKKSTADNHVDPVCGQYVNVDEGYGKMYQGLLYRFCSRACLDKFETNLENYIQHPNPVDGGSS